MSLQLRQALQTTLDEANLSNMHAGINSNKYLEIVGECGKPLFILSGVCFGTKNPKAAEIEYANLLLSKFINTNKTKVVELIESTIALNDATKPELPESISHNNFSSSAVGKAEDGRVICNLSTGTTVNISHPIQSVIEYFCNNYSQDVEVFSEWSQLNTHYLALVQDVYAAKQALQSCDI